MKSYKSCLLLLFTFHLSASFAFAGWVVHVHHGSSGLPATYVVIRYYVGKELARDLTHHETFKEALEEVKSTGLLEFFGGVRISYLLREPVFQKEVWSELEMISPNKLKAALKSAGNMHNPKMTLLRKDFTKAVLATKTVRTMDRELEVYGLRVEGASHEKLMLFKREGEKEFSAILSLDVKKLEQMTEPKIETGSLLQLKKIKSIEFSFARDGGTISASITDSKGKSFILTLDGRMHSPTRGNFFLGLPSPKAANARKLKVWGNEEEVLKERLNEWLTSNADGSEHKIKTVKVLLNVFQEKTLEKRKKWDSKGTFNSRWQRAYGDT